MATKLGGGDKASVALLQNQRVTLKVCLFSEAEENIASLLERIWLESLVESELGVDVGAAAHAPLLLLLVEPPRKGSGSSYRAGLQIQNWES